MSPSEMRAEHARMYETRDLEAEVRRYRGVLDAIARGMVGEDIDWENRPWEFTNRLQGLARLALQEEWRA